MTQPPIPDEIVEESPATKLVYRELAAAEEPLPFGELVDRTTLSKRATRRGIRALERVGLVTESDADREDHRVTLFAEV